MISERFFNAEDVQEVLMIGRTKAYHIIKILNEEEELKSKVYLTQQGRIPKHYFMERFGLERRG